MNGDLVNRKLVQTDGRLTPDAQGPEADRRDAGAAGSTCSPSTGPPTPPRWPRPRPSSPRPRAGRPEPRTCSGRCSIPRNFCLTIDRYSRMTARGWKAATSCSSRQGGRLALASCCAGAPSWRLWAARTREDMSRRTYERDIKPLFAKRCTVCHRGVEAQTIPTSRAGWRSIRSRRVLAGTNAQQGRRRRASRPRASLLRRLADADDDRRMPLEDKPLSEPQQELVRRWIDAGAPRGVPVAAAASGHAEQRRATAAPCAASARSTSSLPTDVKLAPGTLDAAKGGALAVGAPDRAVAGGDGPGACGETAGCWRSGLTAQVVLWDLDDGRPAAAIRRDSRTGARPGIQPRRPTAGRRRGPAGPLGRGAGLLRPRWHA